MKNGFLILSIIMITLSVRAFEIEVCEVLNTPHVISYSDLTQVSYEEFLFLPTQIYQNSEAFVMNQSHWFSQSKQTCEKIAWLDKEAIILSTHLTAAGLACSQMGHPVAKTIGFVISVIGVGIQYIKIHYSGDLQHCEKIKQEEEARSLIKRYLEAQGAKVIMK